MIAVLSAAAAGAEQPASAIAVAAPDPVVFGDAPCPWPAPAGRVDCHTLQVRQSRGDADSPMIRLFVAITRSLSDEPAPDPVLILAGGPGQSASAEVPRRWYRFMDLRAGRDIIFVDQRGAGHGSPLLACPGLVVTRTPEREGLERCLASLVEEGVDPAAYNTVASALDLRDLRLALGIDRWNVIATSYGTGLALELMRRDPIGVRSAVLNSPRAPHQFFSSTAFAANRQRVFEMFFADCAADPVCAAAYPDLKARFLDLRELLADDPVRLADIEAGDGDASADVAVDGEGAETRSVPSESTVPDGVDTDAFAAPPPIPEPFLTLRPLLSQTRGYDVTAEPVSEAMDGPAPEGPPAPDALPDAQPASQSDPQLVSEPQSEPAPETEPTLPPAPETEDDEDAREAPAGELVLGFADLVDGLSERIGVSDAAGSAPFQIARLHAALRGQLELTDEEVRAAFGNGALRRSLDGLAYALNVSVLCREEYPFVDYAALDGELAAFAPYVDPTRIGDVYRIACPFWGAGRADPAFLEPVAADVPTLVLSGAYDLYTPPDWAVEVAETLLRGTLVTFPGIGHDVLGSAPCAQLVAATFIADPENPPDTGCVARFGPALCDTGP